MYEQVHTEIRQKKFAKRYDNSFLCEKYIIDAISSEKRNHFVCNKVGKKHASFCF